MLKKFNNFTQRRKAAKAGKAQGRFREGAAGADIAPTVRSAYAELPTKSGRVPFSAKKRRVI